MYNFPRNNGMGMPSANQGQPLNVGGITVLYIPYRRIDERSNEQIWESAQALEARAEYRVAFREFSTLASRGVTEAKFKLGQYCFLALGQPESFSRAYLAFQRAAADGHEEAQKMVALFDQFPILKSLS